MDAKMNHFPTQILLATDGSENTTQATRAAIDIASGRGSRIHLVHVWLDVHTPHAHTFVNRELRRQGREVLDQEVRRIEEQGGSVTWSHLREGRIFEEVIKLGNEREADLLVVGSRGHRGVRRMLVGSHSEDIVHHARRPVMVVRRGEDVWPPARIVAGDDFSEDARKAAELAANLGNHFGARMLLLHAVPRSSRAPHKAVAAELEDRADELEDILQQRPQTRIVAGDSAEVLLEAAQEGEGPGLVAVGSRGLGLLGRLRLGSVSTEVVRAGLGAVLVCPPEGKGRLR
jgi:nucleotide-binding universal stress UspA family protein